MAPKAMKAAKGKGTAAMKAMKTKMAMKAAAKPPMKAKAKADEKAVDETRQLSPAEATAEMKKLDNKVRMALWSSFHNALGRAPEAVQEQWADVNSRQVALGQERPQEPAPPLLEDEQGVRA